MKEILPPLYAGTVTKYVFVESYKATPDDIAARGYEVSGGVMIKETCFGLQVTGPEEEVERVVAHIRALDPAHIYVKDRGFPPGDPRRCRANLGGARPGYFGHEYEMGFIRRIAVGIEKLDDSSEPAAEKTKKKGSDGLCVERLKELIDQEA